MLTGIPTEANTVKVEVAGKVTVAFAVTTPFAVNVLLAA
jgi:hypothetical protein